MEAAESKAKTKLAGKMDKEFNAILENEIKKVKKYKISINIL